MVEGLAGHSWFKTTAGAPATGRMVATATVATLTIAITVIAIAALATSSHSLSALGLPPLSTHTLTCIAVGSGLALPVMVLAGGFRLAPRQMPTCSVVSLEQLLTRGKHENLSLEDCRQPFQEYCENNIPSGYGVKKGGKSFVSLASSAQQQYIIDQLKETYPDTWDILIPLLEVEGIIIVLEEKNGLHNYWAKIPPDKQLQVRQELARKAGYKALLKQILEQIPLKEFWQCENVEKDTEAYRELLQGREFYKEFSPQELKQVVLSFKDSIQKIPEKQFLEIKSAVTTHLSDFSVEEIILLLKYRALTLSDITSEQVNTLSASNEFRQLWGTLFLAQDTQEEAIQFLVANKQNPGMDTFLVYIGGVLGKMGVSLEQCTALSKHGLLAEKWAVPIVQTLKDYHVKGFTRASHPKQEATLWYTELGDNIVHLQASAQQALGK